MTGVEVWEVALAFFLGLCGAIIVMGGLLMASTENDIFMKSVYYIAGVVGGAVLVVALLIAQGALW